MTSPTVQDDAAFEAEIRAMLARRAAGFRPERSPVPAPGLAPPARTRPRGLGLLAAAAAVLVVGGAIALLGGDGDRTTTGPSSAPGAAVTELVALWPVVGEDALAELAADPGELAPVLATPETAADAYLAELAPAATRAGDAAQGGTGRTTVDWSSGGGHRGTVSLRDAGTAERPLWVVDGADTDGVTISLEPAIEDALPDGSTEVLGFTVEAEGRFILEARIDGTVTPFGRDPLPPGAPLSEGAELSGVPVTFLVPARPGTDVDVLVRAVDGEGGVQSVTHAGFHVPDLRPEPAPEPEPEVTAPTDPATADTTLAAPADPGATTLSGAYEGNETFTRGTGGNCDLDHVLDLTLTPAAGEPWTMHATYCGVMEGEERWRGEGPVVITTAAGDTLTGRLVSAADLPTDGEPFTVEVTGGTGAYDGAAGTCNFDNHLVPMGPGAQEQFGEWSCSITP
jgi:hypothetical protein